MQSRQRGALWLLLLVLCGRILDQVDLPWTRAPAAALPPAVAALRGDPAVPTAGRPATTAHGVAADSAASPASFPAATAETAPTADAPLRINQVGAAQLQALPGVGPVLAARIEAHRRQHGPFRDIASLRQVKGIGPRLAERLAPLLRFD